MSERVGCSTAVTSRSPAVSRPRLQILRSPPDYVASRFWRGGDAQDDVVWVHAMHQGFVTSLAFRVTSPSVLAGRRISAYPRRWQKHDRAFVRTVARRT